MFEWILAVPVFFFLLFVGEQIAILRERAGYRGWL